MIDDYMKRNHNTDVRFFQLMEFYKVYGIGLDKTMNLTKARAEAILTSMVCLHFLYLYAIQHRTSSRFTMTHCEHACSVLARSAPPSLPSTGMWPPATTCPTDTSTCFWTTTCFVETRWHWMPRFQMKTTTMTLSPPPRHSAFTL